MLRTAAVLLALLLPLPLAAQTVRGTLVEEAGGGPVGSALVLLLDADGKSRAGALTDASGAFAITAPGPGSYTLRAERIGHASVTSPPLSLRAGETVEHRLVAPSRMVALEGITVKGRSGRRCEVRPGSGTATLALWEEARKALNAAVWARDSRQHTYEVVRFERELDPGSLRVVREDRTTKTEVTTHPFESIPADSLSRRGFVQTTPEGTFYYAPDAHVLLSDSFLNDHCFHVAEGGEEGLVGLAFEPVRGRSVPDVRGVFWLDQETAELRYLEYGYVRPPVSVPAGKLGGRVEFERLPTGAWIVGRWAIRMPQIVREVATTTETTGSLPGRRSRERLTAIHEQGGEVAVAGTGARRLPARVALAGSVYDSLGAAPLAGASVFLSGTAHRAVTDAEGRFRMAGVPEGDYSLSFSHPVLAALGVAPPVRAVSLRGGDPAAVELATPSAGTLATALCPGKGGAALAGTVRDARGEPVRDAEVVLSWGRGGRVEARSDAEGVYRACGIPGGARVAVQVRAEGLAPARAEVRLVGGALALQDLSAGEAVRLGPDGRPIPLEGVRVTASGRSRGASDPRNRLSAEEIVSSRARSAHDAVERLRPHWLRIRGLQAASLGTRGRDGVVTSHEIKGENVVRRESVGVDQRKTGADGQQPSAEVQAVQGLGQSEIAVYMDGMRLGGVEELRRIPANEVAAVEFLDGPSATIRFGTGHAQGAIVVTGRRS